ncbi:MAG: DUF4838 domain-containing protein [Aquificae bacterium]|nr:DUF4838 domain-containing protein [Aquificota bacterium]
MYNLNFLKGIVKVVLAFYIFVFIISLFSCGEGADQKILIDKQEFSSGYKIVVLGNSKEEIFAGKELSKYIKSLTKEDVQILTHLDKDILEGKYIIVGLAQNSYIREVLGINAKFTKDQSFMIKTFDDDIIITADSPIGIVYGAYHFLENYLGFRFLSKDFTYIPTGKIISIPSNLEDLQSPRFFYREIFINESEDPDFALRLKLNGRLGHRNHKPLRFGNVFVKLNSIFDLVPKKYAKKHPEYFCGGQLDFTNPAVKEIALKNARKILKNYKNIDGKFYFVISNADTGFYCANKSSIKRIKEGKAPSTPYLDFIVYLATRLKKEYPNAIFTASAYLWSRKPPKVYDRLPDNTAVFFCDIEADFSKPIYEKENKKIYKDLKNWTKISDHIVIWHYITNFNNYFQPYPNIYSVSENIKTYAKLKQIKGVFLQGSYGTPYGDMSDLKLYLFARLLWNPNLDSELIIDDFLKKFYGKSYQYIKEYIQLLYQSSKENPYPLRTKLIQKTPYLNAEFFVKAENIFNKALSSVDEDSIFYKNIKKLKFGVDLMLLLNLPYLQKTAEEKGLDWFSPVYLKTLKRELKAFIKQNNIRVYSEGGRIKDLLTLIDIDRSTVTYPKEAQGYTLDKDWFDYQEYLLQICCGARFERDPLASDKVAVSMPGHSTAWGIQLNLSFLPKGKWKLYFSIRVEPTATYSKNSPAFRYGVYRKIKRKEKKLAEFLDGKYHTIYVGTVKNTDGKLWIAPAGNKSVKKIYIDRVFIIKAN